MKLKLWQIDAFANRALEGNPAAVVPLDAWLDAGLMQKIANENNLAETAFFVKTAPGRYDLRWFTPVAEVDLCGHATLASAWLVFGTLDPELKSVSFQTRSGQLIVTRGPDGRHAMSMPADSVAPFEAPAGFARELGEKHPGEKADGHGDDRCAGDDHQRAEDGVGQAAPRDAGGRGKFREERPVQGGRALAHDLVEHEDEDRNAQRGGGGRDALHRGIDDFPALDGAQSHRPVPMLFEILLSHTWAAT